MASTDLLHSVDSRNLAAGVFLSNHRPLITLQHGSSLKELRLPLSSTGTRSPLESEAKLIHVENCHGALISLLENNGGCAIVDGGLATELERRGADINDPLWSAKCLLDDESAALVRQVHLDYFRAGADIGISASYQATIQGFVARGVEPQKAEWLLQRSVELVCEARDIFWREYVAQTKGGHGWNGDSTKLTRQRGLVAASVGSYGAYLADGSEYSGDYGPEVTVETLVEFHRRRLQVLAHSGADIIALETIPSLQEAQALVQLLDEENLPIPAWIAFNSKDGRNVVRGDSFEACIRLADSCKHIVAVGINCTAPRYIHRLVKVTRQITKKPIIIYPNSGEEWDGEKKEWVESTRVKDGDFVSYAPFWRDVGANIFGGCCRTTPDTIKGIRKAIFGSSN